MGGEHVNPLVDVGLGTGMLPQGWGSGGQFHRIEN